MKNNLERVALITGASRGVGANTAYLLAEAGLDAIASSALDEQLETEATIFVGSTDWEI